MVSNPLNRAAAIADTISTLTTAGLLAALRPDKYVRMAAAIRREGMTPTAGIALAARRCPERLAVVDEIGSLTWAQLDARCDALAAALQASPGGTPRAIGIMCRNHRGFIEALTAANRVGADVLLLNTSFAGPALAEVVEREGADTMIFDDEFAAAVDRALGEKTDCRRILGWIDSDTPANGSVTLEQLIGEHAGRHPAKASHASALVLLTSGTTGTPKGARRGASQGGGIADMTAMLKRIPWRAEETTVIAAPMFHAWGFGQLVLSALLACTIVTRRKFDPEATLQLVDRYRATGLAVVPVMLNRIMDLAPDVLQHYDGRSLRFATASGSRMRPAVVTAFMDRFGDVVYNNYNATEAGMITTATPADLRLAPDTAGKPAIGTTLRILDTELSEVPAGTVGGIYVRNSSQFEGYTGGGNKEFHEGFMSSGDVGYLDDEGRLFVVGRDDEMIVSGGENVYPLEVEKSLAAHDDVAEASVIGVDDEQYGQSLAAFVVLSHNSTTTPDDLKQHVRQNLASYKVPREINVLDELPRSSTGKVLRSELHARIGPDDETSADPG